MGGGEAAHDCNCSQKPQEGIGFSGPLQVQYTLLNLCAVFAIPVKMLSLNTAKRGLNGLCVLGGRG